MLPSDVARCPGAGYALCTSCRRCTEATYYQVQTWQMFQPTGDCTAPRCDGYIPPRGLVATAHTGQVER